MRGLGIEDDAIAEVNGAVGDGGEGFVVGDDDEGLTELGTEVEEQLVKALLVVSVEGA